MSMFPNTLYVIIDPETKDTIADENPQALGYTDDTVPMARYVLSGQGEVINNTRYVENPLQNPQAQGLSSEGQLGSNQKMPYTYGS